MDELTAAEQTKIEEFVATIPADLSTVPADSIAKLLARLDKAAAGGEAPMMLDTHIRPSNAAFAVLATIIRKRL